MLSPRLSDIFERHAGRLAVIGLVNDDMNNYGKDHSVETIEKCLEEHKEDVRYSTYIDVDNLARDCKCL